jgi:hypothetical protein
VPASVGTTRSAGAEEAAQTADCRIPSSSASPGAGQLGMEL